MFACSFTRRIHACCLVQLCQGKGSKSTSSIVARLLTNSPRFFSPLNGAESIIRVVSRWWYSIDNKVLNTAFIISNGQEYFHDRSRVCFANFMSVPIIFNRIFFLYPFSNERTMRPSQTYFSCERIWKGNNDDDDDDDIRVYILVKKTRKTQSELFEFDDKTIWRG